MKITVFAAGSRGDIQPCVVLSSGLTQAGYQVCLAAPQDFGDFVQKHGVDFCPLRGDVQKIMASDTGRQFMETGGANPIKSIRAFRTMLGPVVREMIEDAYAACCDADAIVCLAVQSTFGQSIAEALSIPMINVEPTPLLPTKAFAAPSWPIQRNLGGLHNYLSGIAMLQVVWLWYRPFVNEFRQHVGLPMYTATAFHRILKSAPMVSAYSPSIIPHPADWPEHVHVTGYLFLDAQTDWQPSSELNAYLEAGDPPVYIGFGSMAGRDPDRLARLMIDALAKSGQRGLLLTGWGGLRTDLASDNVFVLDSAPHSWLFPRMAAGWLLCPPPEEMEGCGKPCHWHRSRRRHPGPVTLNSWALLIGDEENSSLNWAMCLPCRLLRFSPSHARRPHRQGVARVRAPYAGRPCRSTPIPAVALPPTAASSPGSPNTPIPR